MNGLITVFKACGKTTERRDVFTICKRPLVMWFEIFLKKSVVKIS